MSGIRTTLLLLCGFIMGMAVDGSPGAKPDAGSSGYLVVAGKTVNPEGLGAYVAAAGDAISAAGLNRVGRSAHIGPEQILEGSWPYDGFVAIEHVQSMDKLQAFWHSDQFQQIKKLREGRIEIDFVIAVDAFLRDTD